MEEIKGSFVCQLGGNKQEHFKGRTEGGEPKALGNVRPVVMQARHEFALHFRSFSVGCWALESEIV
jgi:hypothetical protein